jgi:DNA-binding NarL/FixJ family response regulator
VLILSMHSSEEYVLRALRAGCSGYLLKGSAVSELEIAVRAVARGETYLSPGSRSRSWPTTSAGWAEPEIRSTR